MTGIEVMGAATFIVLLFGLVAVYVAIIIQRKSTVIETPAQTGPEWYLQETIPTSMFISGNITADSISYNHADAVEKAKLKKRVDAKTRHKHAVRAYKDRNRSI